MTIDFLVLTNNPLVKDRLRDKFSIRFLDTGFLELLTAARDSIHSGHKLLSHPLSGSVKPNENPFKSLLLGTKTGALDVESLMLIENAIMTYHKFAKRYGALPAHIQQDFMLIDLSLIESAAHAAARSLL